MDREIDCVRQGPSFSFHADAQGINEPEHFGPGTALDPDDIGEGLHEPENTAVDEGTERLHQVGSEGEMIVLGMMMDAEIGVERGGAKISCESGVKDGISIIEQLVGIGCVAIACGEKIQTGPVAGSGASFEVIGIAAADFGFEGIETDFTASDQIGGLASDLGPDQSPPKLFAPRFGGIDLESDQIVGIGPVSNDRIDHGDGKVLRSAGNHGDAFFGQQRDDGASNGNGGFLQDDGIKVIGGDESGLVRIVLRHGEASV